MRGKGALLLGAVLAAGPAGADDSPQKQFAGEVADLVEAALHEHAAVSRYALPDLDADQMEELLRGDVVRIRWKQPLPPGEPGSGTAPGEKGDGDEAKERHRVVAMYLIERPRAVVWLAALDPHMVVNDKLTEACLSSDNRGGSRWYQFMDLPWPVQNRHWVIDVGPSLDVAEATGGRAWEQPWSLVANGEALAYEATAAGRVEGITLDEAKEAHYLDANTGAWAMFELAPDLTLLTYQLTVVLGGLIPEGLAARFAMRELESLCRTVEKNTDLVAEHYDAAHDPVAGGDGRPIPAPVALP